MKLDWMTWIVMLIVGIIFTAFGGLSHYRPNTTYIYEGKIALWTEEEYVEFKEFVAPAEVQIQELDILSSEPPIIIQFTIEADKGQEFPYGKVTGPHDGRWMLFAGLPLLSCAIGFAASRRVDWF